MFYNAGYGRDGHVSCALRFQNRKTYAVRGGGKERGAIRIKNWLKQGQGRSTAGQKKARKRETFFVTSDIKRKGGIRRKGAPSRGQSRARRN